MLCLLWQGGSMGPCLVRRSEIMEVVFGVGAGYTKRLYLMKL